MLRSLALLKPPTSSDICSVSCIKVSSFAVSEYQRDIDMKQNQRLLFELQQLKRNVVEMREELKEAHKKMFTISQLEEMQN
jgi:uncharacterized membrane protein YjjP (DUF1212 family)